MNAPASSKQLLNADSAIADLGLAAWGRKEIAIAEGLTHLENII